MVIRDFSLLASHLLFFIVFLPALIDASPRRRQVGQGQDWSGEYERRPFLEALSGERTFATCIPAAGEVETPPKRRQVGQWQV
jgi:hypothetical protein